MASLALSLNGKSCIAIMTDPAVCPLAHGIHFHFLALMFRLERVRMAVTAYVPHFHMNRMAENGIADSFVLP